MPHGPTGTNLYYHCFEQLVKRMDEYNIANPFERATVVKNERLAPKKITYKRDLSKVKAKVNSNFEDLYHIGRSPLRRCASLQRHTVYPILTSRVGRLRESIDESIDTEKCCVERLNGDHNCNRDTADRPALLPGITNRQGSPAFMKKYKPRVKTPTPIHGLPKPGDFMNPCHQLSKTSRAVRKSPVSSRVCSPVTSKSSEIIFPEYNWTQVRSLSDGQNEPTVQESAESVRTLVESIMNADSQVTDKKPTSKPPQCTNYQERMGSTTIMEADCSLKGYGVFQELDRGRTDEYCRLLLANNKGNAKFNVVEVVSFKKSRANATSALSSYVKLSEGNSDFCQHIKALNPHQNLTMLLHRFETTSWIFQVTEHCPWPSIDDLLMVNSSASGLSEKVCRHIFKRVCMGLNHLHQFHIVHGDLNCRNILVNTRLQVKLTGYGPCCQRMLLPRDKKLNKFQTISRVYTPPETLNVGAMWTLPSDIWCLGICLFHMAQGEIPKEVICADNNPVMKPRSGKDSNNTYQLSLLVNKMLSGKPNFRPTVKEILSHAWLVDFTSWPEKMNQCREKQKVFRTDGVSFPLPHRIKAKKVACQSVSDWNLTDTSSETTVTSRSIASNSAASAGVSSEDNMIARSTGTPSLNGDPGQDTSASCSSIDTISYIDVIDSSTWLPETAHKNTNPHSKASFLSVEKS